jgi:diguanylate cyclase (GGDEF)-like protein
LSDAKSQGAALPADRSLLSHRNAERAELAALSRVIETDEFARIRRAVFAAGQATYHWITESDQIFWSANAPELFGCSSEVLATGKSYASCFDPETPASRFDAVMNTDRIDPGGGVPFEVEYLFRPDGRGGGRSLWVEDVGRWYGDEHGRPAEVYGVVRRVDERHSRDQHLRFLGTYDPLTGMINRARMTEVLGEAIAAAVDQGRSCAFAIAAINNLNLVNDSYGYDVADQVIAAVGRRLRQVARAGDAIARYSGSKFGVILNDCSEGELEIACERFLSVARESVIDTTSGPVWAMLSIGGLTLPAQADGAPAAIARAEEALAEARKLPADGFVAYKPSARRNSERSLNARCAAEIVTCLKENRFRLAFQPIVAARTGKTVMHEALLRMADIGGELVLAAHLIPIAEKLGLVRLIDRTVTQLAIAALLSEPGARLAFNISGITATDPRWCHQLVAMLSSHPEAASRLTIEITETVALADIEETTGFTSALHELGCTVAIDDFGRGYSSFDNLRALNVDLVKLDGSFCKGISANRESQHFVAAFVDLARNLGIGTIAEWVQSQADAEFLRNAGVDFLQGNLFGPPSVALPWPPGEPDRSPADSSPAGVSLKAAPEPHTWLAEEEFAPEGDVLKLRQALAILDETFGRPAR